MAEIFTLDLVFAMVAGGALAAALVAAADRVAGSPSVLAFALSTGLLLLVVRPPLLAYSRRSGPVGQRRVDALVGRRAEVLDRGRPARRAGEARRRDLVGAGRTGRPDDDGRLEPLETGSTVYVVRIDGATAVVSAFPTRPTRRTRPVPPGPVPPRPPGAAGADLRTDRRTEAMESSSVVLLVVLFLVVIFVVSVVVRTIRIVPQASAIIVERLGRYSRTLERRPALPGAVRRPPAGRTSTCASRSSRSRRSR